MTLYLMTSPEYHIKRRWQRAAVLSSDVSQFRNEEPVVSITILNYTMTRVVPSAYDMYL